MAGKESTPPPDGGKERRQEHELRYLVGLAGVAALVLMLLMTYSIVLLLLGFEIEVVAAAEAALCVLTVQMVRFLTRPGGPVPTWPWLMLPPVGGDRGAA